MTWAAYGLIALVGAALRWGVTLYPARMPVVAPFEVQWPIYLAVTLSGLWFERGLSRRRSGRASGGRRRSGPDSY